mmetsp:Transcript_20899/g.45561  ORF Transcript_20899/g.45561 Transcript_20899/m.45561 type:complete len:480 (+) Transcript_20899:123-1562(+)
MSNNEQSSNGSSNTEIDTSDTACRASYKRRSGGACGACSSRRSSRYVDDDADLEPVTDRIFASVASSEREIRGISIGSSKDSMEGISGNIISGRSDSSHPPRRMVAVRYFLDRPGYGLHNSALRFWFDPPATCTPADVHDFLRQQGIALDGLLIEVYLDKFQSFMMLEACEASLVEWHFDDTNYNDPGVLCIRLTDLAHAEAMEGSSEHSGGGNAPAVPSKQQAAQQQSAQMANTIPAGLLSFSMMVGLETTALMGQMFPGTVSASYQLAWGPYMLFVGGLLQIIVGIFQVLRNNIYGAIAFLGFGSFWFSNGTITVLRTYFAVDGSVAADELLDVPDPAGTFVRILFILAFSCVLLKQTLVMNKLSTTLITLLCIKLAFQSFSEWFDSARYGQLVFGWATSLFAFYVFTAEFTNAVYHREVFRVHKWCEKTSPEEVFGAVGRQGTLFSKAARLRRASYPIRYKVRAARDAMDQAGKAD